MKTVIKKRICAISLGLFLSATAQAWIEGNVHFHEGRNYYSSPYYDRGWVGPNIIIDVPAERYYIHHCENVEVCDNYTDECWLERYCH